MTQRYSLGSKPVRHWRKIAGVAVVSILIFGIVLGLVLWQSKVDTSSGKSQPNMPAPEQSVVPEKEEPSQKVEGESFTFTMPGGWKEVARKNSKEENSSTWVSTVAYQQKRTLKLYIDTIPDKLAIRQLLTVSAQADKLVPGKLSPECNTLPGVKPASKDAQPVTWENVPFLCAPTSSPAGVIGTGSPGAVNTTTITGKSKGPHKYFFVFTDPNDQQDVQTFQDIIKSFQAK